MLILKFGGSGRFQKREIKFNGLKFTVVDTLSFLWQYKEIYVDGSYKFKTENSNPLIIDCGANVGTSVAFFKQCYPNSRIVAIEGNPEIAEILSLNIEKNSLTGVEVKSAAVWLHEGKIPMLLEAADSSTISDSMEATEVNCIRLKDLLLSFKDRIDLLKIDIEGAETKVLIDCSDELDLVRNLFVEYHSFTKEEQELDKLLGVLKGSGFRVFISTVNSRREPFINRNDEYNKPMDMQLNIYAYRD
ncbi:MAG: FkbM family methyltransferase [Ignavibacteriaceae bacterium]|nr:FkbM family methyltransferase [Ignavibacteriaceae bacterium]